MIPVFRRFNRRRFLQYSAGSSALLFAGFPVLAKRVRSQPSRDQEPLDPLAIPKYAHELTIPPVYVPTVIRGRSGEVIRHEYKVSTEMTRAQVLPPGFPMTTVLAYGGRVRVPESQRTEVVHTSPGPAFVNTRGIPTRVRWRNEIMEAHFLPVDPTLDWANPNAIEPPEPPFLPFPPGYPEAQFPVTMTTHNHGLEVRPEFDGTPNQWFTAFGQVGPAYVSNVSDYPNSQPATNLWYHDHSLGTTRLNVYAGLVGNYFIRDPNAFLDGPDSPLPKEELEIPLFIVDRSFFTDGELAFPRDGRDDLRHHHPYIDGESRAEVPVVNGRVWPNLNVQRRQYRFRVLTASNERVWTLVFAEDTEELAEELEELAELDDEEALEEALEKIEFTAFTIIGSDGGYLSAPQVVDRVRMATPERADILVDFCQFEPGTQLILRNIHIYEDELADPHTNGQIMRFTVVDSDPVPAAELDASLFPVLPVLSPDAPHRTKVMVRFRDDTETNRLRSQDGLGFDSRPTEFPLVGSTEQWDIVHPGEADDDADAGTHQIHIHLIQFQILGRQEIDAERYLQDWHRLNGHRPVTRPIVLDPTPFLIGDPIPPEPYETGWKDTILALPGMVNRIITRWAPQETPAGGVAPGENLFPFDPTMYPNDTFSESGYVWHCHILGHEDHDMMRPQPVVAAWAPGVSYPVGRVVAHENIDYRVRVTHTSQASEPPTARFDVWERVNNNDGSWQPQIIYALDDRVLHEGQLYAALHVHQAEVGLAPTDSSDLWTALPMTAKAQLVEFVPPGDPDGYHALGQNGTEDEALAVLARALAKYQPVHALPSAGIAEDPIVFSVPDGTTFRSAPDTDTGWYETTSRLHSITMPSGLRNEQTVTVNGREMKPGVNHPLPPRRNHGYIIKTTGGATFTAT